jgi:hypothetical protein
MLIEHGREQPKKAGAKARPARWGDHDKARKRALELWSGRDWPSKRACARKITPEIQALLKGAGKRLLDSNAEETVYNWLLKAGVSDEQHPG